MNCELPDEQTEFRKSRGTRDQIANIIWTIERAREFQKKNIRFIDYTKSFDCVDHNKLWKILTEMGIPDCFDLIWLKKSVCRSRSKVRTRCETADWFQIGKGVCQGCILSPYLFNLYAEYIMWNAGLDEAQAGIKIAGKYISNLTYAEERTPPLW